MRAKQQTRYGVTTRACTSIVAAVGAALVTVAAMQGCSFDDSTDAAKPYHAQDGGAEVLFRRHTRIQPLGPLRCTARLSHD